MSINIQDLDIDIRSKQKQVHQIQLEVSQLECFRAWLGMFSQGDSKQKLMEENNAVFHGEYTDLIDKYIK